MDKIFFIYIRYSCSISYDKSFIFESLWNIFDNFGISNYFRNLKNKAIKTDIDKNKVELFLNFLMLINNKKKVFYVVVFIPMFNHTIIDGPDYIYMIQNIYA